VAVQKRSEYLRLIRGWTQDFQPARALKTDLFEEASGDDRLLADMVPGKHIAIGIDVSPAIARRASQRCPEAHARYLAADVRRIPFPDGCIDLIVSTSTLDHFDSREGMREAASELARVLRSGGRLIVALDNPLNPFYLLLRGISRRRGFPFPLGRTVTRRELTRMLEDLGLEIRAAGELIHNPRLFSTLLFLGLRRLLGTRADAPIRSLLRLFALLGRLPTRSLTACFIAVCASKRPA